MHAKEILNIVVPVDFNGPVTGLSLLHTWRKISPLLKRREMYYGKFVHLGEIAAASNMWDLAMIVGQKPEDLQVHDAERLNRALVIEMGTTYNAVALINYDFMEQRAFEPIENPGLELCKLIFERRAALMNSEDGS